MPTVDTANDFGKKANERTSDMQKTLLRLQTTVNSVDNNQEAQMNPQGVELKLLNTIACNSCDQKAF